MNHNRRLGKWGEDIACQFLIKKGYSILDKNWRSVYGEIDIVAQKDDRLIFVEVKTRTGTDYGWPEEAITPQKQEHLWGCSQDYLDSHPEFHKLGWQIDVIAILNNSTPDENFQIKHYENAVTEL